MGFAVSSMSVLYALFYLQRYGSRLVHQIHLHNSGEQIKLNLNGFVSQEATHIVRLSDLGGLDTYKKGFHFFDSHEHGMIFIDLEKNSQAGFPGNQNLVQKICTGHIFDLDYHQKLYNRYR